MKTNPLRALAVALALLLIAVACGDSGEATTTVAAVAGDPTVPAVAPTTAPPATVAPTTAPPTTAPPTTTTVALTTTTSAVPLGDPQQIVEAKTAAVIAAVPDGWTFADDPDQEEAGEDFIFSPCLDEDDYDLDNLSLDTDAVKETDIMAPAEGSPFGGPMADIEARVFESEEVAIAAFATLEKTLGNEEGRMCLADTVATQFTQDLPVEGEPVIDIQPIEVEGADVAARITVDIDTSGLVISFNIDYAASLIGACTVVSTFLAFDDVFPADVADALMNAAVSAA